MSWLDELQQASFRGVPFQVHTIDVQAGDNVVLREYPFQDLPTVFRMGEGVEEIKFSADVIGDDYIDQREALRNVLTGDGVLVHPTAGSIRVFVAGRFTIKEAPTDEGGMARFDLTFVRAEQRRYPVGVQNTQGDASDAADQADAASEDAFAGGFDLSGVSGWASGLASGRLGACLDAVWAQVGPVMGVIAGVVGPLAQFASDMIGSYQVLRSNFDALLAQPAQLAQSIAGLFAMPPGLEPAQALPFQAAYQALFDMSVSVPRTDFDVSIVPSGPGLVMFGSGNAAALSAPTPVQADRDRLMAAGDQLFEALATSAYVRACAAIDISDYDSGMAMRQAVYDQCNRLLVNASAQPAPDALPAVAWHDAIRALQTAALKDLQARTRDLVRMTAYTPQAWMPVWYVSYLLYGTASYADEILTLNPHILHPLLVPPGVALRVMAHS